MSAPTRWANRAGRSIDSPRDRTGAAGRLDQTEQDPDRRRFPGAIGPNEAHQAARRHLEGQVVNRCQVAEPPRQVVCGYRWHHFFLVGRIEQADAMIIQPTFGFGTKNVNRQEPLPIRSDSDR